MSANTTTEMYSQLEDLADETDECSNCETECLDHKPIEACYCPDHRAQFRRTDAPGH